ncbi:PDZ domain-containing protein, partial [Nonomuraea sp. NPDC055795]
ARPPVVGRSVLEQGVLRPPQLARPALQDRPVDVPGALVRQITENSPAAKAGLKQGDLITRIGDKPVDGGDTVVGQVRGFKPGQQVKIIYMRDGKQSEVTVTLEEKK